jgi:hypothetical protein
MAAIAQHFAFSRQPPSTLSALSQQMTTLEQRVDDIEGELSSLQPEREREGERDDEPLDSGLDLS